MKGEQFPHTGCWSRIRDAHPLPSTSFPSTSYFNLSTKMEADALNSPEGNQSLLLLFAVDASVDEAHITTSSKRCSYFIFLGSPKRIFIANKSSEMDDFSFSTKCYLSDHYDVFYHNHY